MSLEFSSIRRLTARKPHRCQECRGVIETGERYVRHASKYDALFADVAYCGLCDRLWNMAWDVGDIRDPEEAPPLGEVRAFLKEECGVPDPEATLIEWEAEQALKRTRRDAAPWLAEDLAAYLARA